MLGAAEMGAIKSINPNRPHANVFVASWRPIPSPPREAPYGQADRGGMEPKGPSMPNERPVYEGLADKYAARVGERSVVVQADLSQPLGFARLMTHPWFLIVGAQKR
jgi:hypothetical protein